MIRHAATACRAPTRSRGSHRSVRGDISIGVAVAVALVAIALMAWWMYWPETFPILRQRPEAAPGARATGPGQAARAPDTRPGAGGESPPLYKWRDESGQLHITDQPPANRPFEKVVVDGNTNVLPSEDATAPAEPGEGRPPPE